MSTKSANGDMSPVIWSPERPHNHLPRLPPAVELETKAVLKQCVAARVALAELKQAAQLIPNPAMLISTLPLLEAQASSEIENVITTTDRLFEHVDAEGTADAATKEALRYRRALLSGVETLGEHPLSTRTAEDVCSLIKGTEMRVRRLPGTALSTTGGGAVVYTPPEGETLLRDLLSNWERFVHEQTSLDPLVRMAVGHYQFEAIHPFADGNGRTGRLLNSLFLVEAGLLTLPILYLSRYIIATKTEYYRLLLEVTRDGQWEPWIQYMLRGVEETATWTAGKVGAIRELAAHTAEYVRAARAKIYSHELVNVIFEQPYCRIAHLGKAGIAGRQTASRYLKALVELGVLREQRVGRDKLFVHPKLMALMTRESNEFALYG